MKLEFRIFCALIRVFEMYCLLCVCLFVCVNACVGVCMHTCTCMRDEKQPMARDRDTERERACTGAWQAGYYNNEDGCVYHELCIPFQSFPPSIPLSLSGSLEWLRLRPTSGRPGPHLDAPALLLQLVLRGRCVWVCGYVSSSSASTTRSHPSTFVAKARCSYGGVMGCGI